jgi:hypothetical protein
VPTPVETGNNQEDGQSDMSLTINAKYIEGIGNIGYGNMTNIICDYADSDNEAATVECFNNLYDKDGNVLYNGSNFSVPDTNSVDVIYENDSSCETAPIYDLMGRRITSPTKGQIYIQNGKKLVGQCSK